MTLPRWVIPVVATVVAIAVAVTATLFAVRFAPPEMVRAAAETIEVPVLAPVDEAGSLEALVADAGDEIPVSPTIAVREVIDPDSVPEGALPESISSLLDDLAAADDPADVMPSGAGSIADAPTGDPCADVEEADCPEGAPGTIMTVDGDLDLLDLDLPPLMLWADGSASADCAAADPPSVRFWARTNRPVTIQVNPPLIDGVRRPPLVVETTDEQVDRWLEAEPDATGEAWIEHCIEIDNVLDDRDPVIVHLDATDDLGRRDGRALTIYPASDGSVSERREIPPTRIHPIGDSMVFVTAPHTAVQTVRMAAVFGGDGAEPECSYDGASFFHYARLPATEVVDPEYLDSHSYVESYTRRTSAAIAVPANTAFIVCVGWFPTPDNRPSFERNTPLRVSEYRMTSPDVVAPVVSVTELVLTESVADGAIRLRGSTENGQSCGGWSAPPFNRSRPNVLCDFGSLLGYNDAGGSLVVTTEVDTPAGEAVNRVLLDVGLLSCVDGCSGRTRSFDVELSETLRPSRICSDDDCFVSSGETVGVARLRATWPESTAGTGEGWVLGTWREGTAAPRRDPAPSFDTTASFDVVPSGLPAERSYRASAAISADRPVTVVAELISDERLVGLCPRPGGTTRWESSGGPSTVHTVEFSGLCAGTQYAVLITLTAEDGSTRTYSPAAATAATSFWPRAGFTTPAENVTVVVDDVRLSIGDPSRVVRLDGVQVLVGGTDTRVFRNPEQACWVGDIHGVSSGLSTVAVGESVSVRVTMSISDGRNPVNPTTEVYPTRCGSVPRSGERLEFVGYISYSELVAGPTLTITDPDTGYSVRVRLTDRLS
ncbi:hypothetical protein BH09ACT3_BH09ACT3_15350 [soil metagenome]